MLGAASGEVDAEFVGLLFRDDNLDKARTFEREFGIDYPTIVDEDARCSRWAATCPPRRPTTYVLDEQGRVAALISGEVKGIGSLEDIVTETAAEGDAQ